MKKKIDKYYTGWDLLERLDITPFQLLKLIKKHKLRPHDQTGEFACRPDSMEFIKQCNQITRNLLALKNSIRAKISKGITRSEYRDLENIRQKLHIEYQSLYEKHPWDPFDWTTYFPELDESGTEGAFKLICDLFFHEVDILKLEGKYEDKIIDKSGELGINDIIQNVLDDRIHYSEKSEFINEGDIKFIDDEVIDKHKDQNSDILDPDELKTLISVGKNAEDIYYHIREEVGVTDKALNSRSLRRDAAMDFFRKKLKGNSLIAENHLEDLDIYTFKSEQTLRNFMRRLLNKIMRDVLQNKRVSGSRLYSLYKSEIKKP